MSALKNAFRFAAAAGALGAASLSLTACDASPYAATVGSQTISVNALNHQLAQWASNSTWVREFNAGNSQSQGGNGATVAGTGGAGTYSTSFAADILGDIIQVDSIHQYLAKSGNRATPDEMVAARAVNEYLRNAYWYQFPQQVRSFLVEQLADEAPLAQVPADPSALQGPYSEIQPYLFSNICLFQASAFNAAQAQSLISSAAVNGAQVCYDQTEVEGLPLAEQAAILKMVKPGDISSPIPTSYGFQVLKLARRDSPGFDQGVQRVLAAATNQPGAIGLILGAAHVKVNPRYGTWSNGQLTPPQLTSS